MARKVFIGVAWPYANNYLHIGHLAGAYLPADVFARSQRLMGEDVLMVSGSDSHGTPVTVTAEKEGISPEAVLKKYHEAFIATWQKIGLSFDLYSHTDTATHWRVSHEVFLKQLADGYIYKDVQKQLYDRTARRFLPDRYVEGTCPHCGYEEARGDQCDRCGRTYEAIELKRPRSKMSGSYELDVRETEHFFFDLSKLNAPLLAWIRQGKEHWRSQVINFARAQIEAQDLRGRPITRDLEWGVSIPVPGYEGKRLYVWYEAVIGYLSAAVEWAALKGEREDWRQWWDSAENPEAHAYYFIGKDNIYFHAILWPAMLLAHGQRTLPYDVPANEYLNLGGQKVSKSRGNLIGALDVLERYQVDAWRYALTAMAPETTDTDFTWDDFLARVNNELVATWGNLANRVLGFTAKRFGGRVPKVEHLDAGDEAVLAEVKAGFAKVGDLYRKVRLRAAADEIRGLCQRVNQYLSERAPWTLIKSDEAAAARAVFVALQAIDWLKLMWAPILPEASQKLHRMMGWDGELFGRTYTETVRDERGEHLVLRYDASQASGRWEAKALPPGQQLGTPEILFTKLDEEAVRAETLS